MAMVPLIKLFAPDVILPMVNILTTGNMPDVSEDPGAPPLLAALKSFNLYVKAFLLIAVVTHVAPQPSAPN